MTMKSADDLIVQTENQKLGIVAPEPPKEKNPIKQEIQSEDKASKSSNQEDKLASDQGASESQSKEEEGKPEGQETVPLEDSKSDSEATSSDEETDDYGNPIAKGKTYTEEQVQLMIRDRLARDRQSRGNSSQQDQQVQDAAKDFKSDPNSEESWEAQLESFIEKTLTKVSQKQQNEEWKRREELSQSEFETKFTQGMSRYGDFQDVVGGKPISNSMMMATRSMQDPAAFLYAACKGHSKEIEQIAQMPDAVSQIAAIGRLEERMKKARTVTKAPAPSKKITGDFTDSMPKQSIDQLIMQHAKSKIMR